MKNKPIENIIYAAVCPICEDRENGGSYKGNGHHLAQEITKAVSIALLPKAQRALYDALKSTPKSTREIATEVGMPSKTVSSVLYQMQQKTLLVHSTRKGKLKSWSN